MTWSEPYFNSNLQDYLGQTGDKINWGKYLVEASSLCCVVEVLTLYPGLLSQILTCSFGKIRKV